MSILLLLTIQFTPLILSHISINLSHNLLLTTHTDLSHVQAYTSPQDALDLFHYRSWYTVQYEKVKVRLTADTSFESKINVKNSTQNNGEGDGTPARNSGDATAGDGSDDAALSDTVERGIPAAFVGR